MHAPLGDQVLMILNDLILEQVDIRQIEPDQLRPAIRDPLKLAAGIARQPLQSPANPLWRLPAAPVR